VKAVLRFLAMWWPVLAFALAIALIMGGLNEALP
jgi:hypothetical protein